LQKITEDKAYENGLTPEGMAPVISVSGFTPEWDEDGNPLSKSDDGKFIKSQKKMKMTVPTIEDEDSSEKGLGRQRRRNICKPRTQGDLG
jgi:hypothetical protein